MSYCTKVPQHHPVTTSRTILSYVPHTQRSSSLMSENGLEVFIPHSFIRHLTVLRDTPSTLPMSTALNPFGMRYSNLFKRNQELWPSRISTVVLARPEVRRIFNCWIFVTNYSESFSQFTYDVLVNTTAVIERGQVNCMLIQHIGSVKEKIQRW